MFGEEGSSAGPGLDSLEAVVRKRMSAELRATLHSVTSSLHAMLSV